MPADSLTTWRDKLAENVPTDCKCGVSSIFDLSIMRFVADIQGLWPTIAQQMMPRIQEMLHDRTGLPSGGTNNNFGVMTKAGWRIWRMEEKDEGREGLEREGTNNKGAVGFLAL